MAWLQNELFEKVVSAVFDSIGYEEPIRKILFSNVNKKFFAMLASYYIDRIQLELDADKLNNAPKLTDGTIPFESWLEKASGFLKIYPEANQVIQQALEVINSSSAPLPRTQSSPPSSRTINLVVQEKIIHKDDMVSFTFLESGFYAGISTAQVLVKRFDNNILKILSGKPTIYLGTGWLLSKDLLITNHHVINARDVTEPFASDQDLSIQGENTEIRFDFNSDNMQGLMVACNKLEAFDTQLDYAVVRLKESINRKALRLLSDEILVPEDKSTVVNIIQHPYGYSKKVALRNNHLYKATYPYVSYFTDSAFGASGSPVFNDNWEVIALHRASRMVENINYNGQLTAWVNEGVQLHAILKHLQLNFPMIFEEINS